ncbi:MAG: prepilin-type N-terminal cleavage/methylation domain-containing protein [Actinobacteria bacterium]|nr:prepilin-type N-terminal cleavage/methylation domain-containing protein [Actinomycetota bacterium]
MIERLQAKRNEEGFTLIELLIVIIVLGILAAIVVFAVGSTRTDAVKSACKTDYKSIQLSAEAMNTRNGVYPADPSAGTGALLKAMPSSAGNYSFNYTAVGSPATSYTLTVNDLRPGAAAGTLATCDALP